MVTVDEVRARVQAAAERQIQERTETAAKVAEVWEELGVRRAALAETEQQMSEAMRAALAVMSLEELAEFTHLRKNDLPTTSARKANVRATGGLRRKSSTSSAPANGTTDGESPS